MKIIFGAAIAGILVLAGGCTPTIETKNEIEIKPIEVKPITMNINVNVKVERELEDFFGDLDQQAEQL